jgi:hypothetical protein
MDIGTVLIIIFAVVWFTILCHVSFIVVAIITEYILYLKIAKLQQ